MESEDQYFKFRKQSKCIIFVDGNYMLNVSRALNIKLDMEKLFDELSKGMFRFRTYWFSALESSLDRNNNAYRFLDRLRYIPRTKVYAGRMTKNPSGHFDSALRTDAGVALAMAMADNAIKGNGDYYLLFAGEPEYVPAIRAVQRHGGIVRLVYPDYLGDLTPHPELQKAADERVGLEASFLHKYEYISDYDYNDDDEEDFDDDFIDDDDDFESNLSDMDYSDEESKNDEDKDFINGELEEDLIEEN